MSDRSEHPLDQIRREYTRSHLEGHSLPADPMVLFSSWLEEAGKTSLPDPTAMNLSTIDAHGRPSSRMVLLKDLKEGTLVFFTNYESRKGKEMKEIPEVAAHFYWPELERQVRIEGTAAPIPEDHSDAYWRSRPAESKIAAWASPQSQRINDRNALETSFEEYRRKFQKLKEIPRPAHWGGFAITPIRMEFWQGGAHRLHDRMVYLLRGEEWERFRLAP
ncbi:MAG: pyridoxamine 5'-phosphate oxidase [Bacteroidales bacterium]